MDHSDHVRLIRGGVEGGGATWADLGAGEGAFTLALADVLGQGGAVWAVDRDRRALRENARRVAARFPQVRLETVEADFTRGLGGLPMVDGVVMANALHFVRDGGKGAVLRRIRERLVDGGRFVLVEYNVDRGNTWVPHPLSYPTWERVAREAGFAETRLLATTPSRFLGEIYAALSV